MFFKSIRAVCYLESTEYDACNLIIDLNIYAERGSGQLELAWHYDWWTV